MLLFAGVGTTGSKTDFRNTIFDDHATTPIRNGGAPFLGSYSPQVGLPDGNPGVSGVSLGYFSSQKIFSARTYELVITNNGNVTGTLNSWSLVFQKPVPTTGLGEPVADRSQVGFRVFNMSPTNPLAANSWTEVGPAGVGAKGAGLNPEVSGRVNAVAVDSSDPSGNTVYAAAAAGGIWKTNDFLTTSPAGPTWIALTDNGPTNSLNVGSLTVISRNNDPNQSIIIAGTGDGQALGDPLRPSSQTSRGVGFLRSMDGGKTWTLLDSTDNTKVFSNRDHFFAAGNGTTTYKVVADPKLTPSGNAIIYAALSDLKADGTITYNQLVTASNQPIRGGLWRSVDSGQTWTQMKAGQVTDVVLDPNSGTGAPDGNLQALYAAFRNDGVYFSPNRGQVWNALPGIVGAPLIQNADFAQPQPVPVVGPPSGQAFQSGQQASATQGSTRTTPNSYTTDANGNPNTPAPTAPGVNAARLGPHPSRQAGSDRRHPQGLALSGLALRGRDGSEPGRHRPVPTADPYPERPVGHLRHQGLRPELDPGQAAARSLHVLASDEQLRSHGALHARQPQTDPTGSGTPGGSYYFKGNFSSSLAIDPTNPNVFYFSGTNAFGTTGMIRVDTTGIADAHALYLTNDDPNAGSDPGHVPDVCRLQRPIGPGCRRGAESEHAGGQPDYALLRSTDARPHRAVAQPGHFDAQGGLQPQDPAANQPDSRPGQTVRGQLHGAGQPDRPVQQQRLPGQVDPVHRCHPARPVRTTLDRHLEPHDQGRAPDPDRDATRSPARPG